MIYICISNNQYIYILSNSLNNVCTVLTSMQPSIVGTLFKNSFTAHSLKVYTQLTIYFIIIVSEVEIYDQMLFTPIPEGRKF